MAINENTIIILGELSKRKEPTRPLEIAQAIQVQPIDVGKGLVELAKAGLAVKKDKDKNLWAITDEGTAYMKTLPTTTVTKSESVTLTPPAIPETGTTIPSQSDLFRREGELLGVGSKKGDIQLEAIIKYVERVANLDDLDSVWNALTEMGVADNVKKRWLKLYAQDLPKHKMTDELREKIESGQEDEKVRTETKLGEVPPKPRRFSVVGDQILGDPEGDYNLNEAVKVLAAQRGVTPAQVDPLASMMEAVQMGPQMATATLTAMMPLLTRETPKHDDSPLIAILQTTLQGMQTQMQTLQNLVLTGQKQPESGALEVLRDSFTKQMDTLKEALNQQALENERRERERFQEQFVTTLAKLEQQIALVGQGKTTDTKISLLGDIVNKGFGEVSGLRSDVKSMIPTILSRGQTVKRRTEEEKTKFSQGLDKGIERASATKEAEEKLWPELKTS